MGPQLRVVGSRVVTIGGGHGQAALLRALRLLGVTPTAIVAVSDDGGCSGRLRAERGVPPPGDARRCLGALAADQARARLLEARSQGRCAGNLLLARVCERDGDLQRACDRVGRWLRCEGRVLPAALSPATLSGRTRSGRTLRGESAVAASSEPLSGVELVPGVVPNPAAVEAIASADLVLIGPGSFFTSVLAALAAPGLAAALASRSGVAFVANLVSEGPATDGMTLGAYVASLREHVRRLGGARLGALEIIAPGPRLHRRALDRDALVHEAPLVARGTEHDPGALARAIAASGLVSFRGLEKVAA